MSKAKIIDTELFEDLFKISRKFSKDAVELATRIDEELKNLNSEETREALRGGVGDQVLEAFDTITNHSRESGEQLRTIAKFIDSKLQNAYPMMNKREGDLDASEESLKRASNEANTVGR